MTDGGCNIFGLSNGSFNLLRTAHMLGLSQAAIIKIASSTSSKNPALFIGSQIVEIVFHAIRKKHLVSGTCQGDFPLQAKRQQRAWKDVHYCV